jgi:hypothetical protein
MSPLEALKPVKALAEPRQAPHARANLRQGVPPFTNFALVVQAAME